MKTAIILAAGLGSRLMPITDRVPKSMVPVNGTMMIDNILDQTLKSNFDEIRVVVGYLSQIFKTHLRTHYPMVKIIENKDYDITNNLYSFLLASEEVEGDVLFMNSDLFFKDGFIEEISSATNTSIGVIPGDWNDEHMKVITNEDVKAIGISKKFGADESYAVSCDTYFFKEDDFIDFRRLAITIKEQDKNAWTEVAINEWLKSNPTDLVDVSQYDWCEIDNLEDLVAASTLFSQNDGIFEKYDTYIYDLDGTLYLDKAKLPGSAEVVNKQIKQGKNVYVITNNSAASPGEYHNVLDGLGFNIPEQNIINSSVATIKYIENNFKGSIVFPFGTKSMVEQFSKSDKFSITSKAAEANIIVVGNHKNFTFDAIKEVAVSLQKTRQVYLATNPDIKYPLSDGNYAPDTGSIIRMLSDITGREPMVIGKPNKALIEDFIDGKTILFGDRIYTDMACAKNADIDSALVLTGESSIIDYVDSKIKINYLIEGVK